MDWGLRRASCSRKTVGQNRTGGGSSRKGGAKSRRICVKVLQARNFSLNSKNNKEEGGGYILQSTIGARGKITRRNSVGEGCTKRPKNSRKVGYANDSKKKEGGFKKRTQGTKAYPRVVYR